ncbi:MAG: manganese-dependent inorganic pyrophosphatase [Rickettsiales bacterium]|jgi:manganese-dependent inorganic pyrophosphatase|nr:manganese-dependent inorganic pyrophosphatase [Rickettsiales bacterium]
MAIKVFGHKKPDTDSVVSAIALAQVLKEMGGDAVPYIQGGSVMPGTKFVLEKFGLAVPSALDSVEEGAVALVDTTNVDELPAGIEKAVVKYVVDHHPLMGLRTPVAPEAWISPVGCTSTVLKLMADYYGVSIPAGVAGAMACAILDDTVMFKSPTSTKEDREAVEALAKAAGIDWSSVGGEMWRVKTDISAETVDSLISRDFKDFEFGGKKFGIGQIEISDMSQIGPRRAGLVAGVGKLKSDGGYFGVLFMVTDIMREGTELLVATDDNARLGRVFGADFSNGSAWFDGMMSRKKQVVPPMQEKF